MGVFLSFAQPTSLNFVLESTLERETDMQTRDRTHKFSIGDRFRVKADLPAPADFRERVGTVVAQGPGKAEYTVRLDDDPNPDTYLQSNWMDQLSKTSL